MSLSPNTHAATDSSIGPRQSRRAGPRVLLLGLAVVATAAAAFACNRPRGAEARAQRVADFVAAEFDLDEAQEVKLNGVRDAALVLMRDLQAQREHDAEWLLTQLEAPELDGVRLLALYEERRKAADAHAPLIVEKLVEFHKSLNNEQKSEIAQKARRHLKRHGKSE